MRILFLAHRIPYPPDKGDKIRSFHEVQGLTRHGHEVHVLAFVDDDSGHVHAASLRRLCASVTVVKLHRRRAQVHALRNLLGSAPLSIAYFASRVMRQCVHRIGRELRPDAVVVFSSTMAQYVPKGLISRTVVDLVDVDSEKWMDYARLTRRPTSWLFRLEAERLRQYERAIVERFPFSVVTTARELATLRREVRPVAEGRLHALTNGVDLDRYRPDVAGFDVPPGERPFLAGPEIPRLVFVGEMNYRPNVDAASYFVREVFPLVRRLEPSVEFLVVGRKPIAEVVGLGRVPGVTVTGEVRDVRPYLAAARATIVPLRIARGVQNKTLEAMAMGCAVVATPDVAACLAAEAGIDLLVASSPAGLADEIVSVVRDGPRRRRLQRAGRAFVERRHQWMPMLERFTCLVEAVGLEAVAI